MRTHWLSRCTYFAVAAGLCHSSAPQADLPRGIRFSVTVGGSAYQEQVRDVAMAPNGDLIVVGSTRSPDFPTTAGTLQNRFGGTIRPSDGFILRMTPNGEVIWSTLLGGPNYDRVYGVELDSAGFIYVAGRAGAGFPVTEGALQTTFAGGEGDGAYGPQDGFICKITPDGRKRVFCTFFGDSDPVPIRDIAVSPEGDIFVVTSDATGGFPAEWFSGAYQRKARGDRDVIVARIARDGSRVLGATYLGGTGPEWNTNSIRRGPDGSLFVLFFSRSSDIATASAFDSTYSGLSDLFLARLSGDGSRLIYGTYIGGSGNEDTETHHLEVDREGNAYVASSTTSEDLKTTPGALQRRRSGTPGENGRDAFVIKVSPDGRLLASTYLGGQADEWAEGVAVDDSGRVCFGGSTRSPDFPVTQPGSKGPSGDLFGVVLSPDLSRLEYSVRLGGPANDRGRSAAFGSDGSCVIGGDTRSAEWPGIRLRNAPGGGGDGVVVLIDPPVMGAIDR
jgi:hypothetical protein